MGPAADAAGHPPLVVIAGATASGKTGLSLELAEALRARGRAAEIISADSRQVFRGLDIGTAKVTPAERERVPHHGLDLVEPDQPFTVVDFVAHVTDALAGIAARDAVAILVGGTGFYLRAVARGLDVDALPFDPGLRRQLEADLVADGLARSAARLDAVAPRLAAQIDLHNPRRVVRALEIALIAGDRPRPTPRGYPGRSLWLGLAPDRETHRHRIVERARAQFAGGLVEEAARLRERFDPTLPAFSAIGYREAWAVLDGGLALDEAIALDVARNLAFVRRQRTWFRAEPGIAWLAADAVPLSEASALVDPFLDEPGA